MCSSRVAEPRPWSLVVGEKVHVGMNFVPQGGELCCLSRCCVERMSLLSKSCGGEGESGQQSRAAQLGPEFQENHCAEL